MFWQRVQMNRKIRKLKPYPPDELCAFEPLVAELAEKHTPVTKKKLGMKVLAISDSHGYFAFDNRMEKLMSQHYDFDVCMLLGDIEICEMEKLMDFVRPEEMVAVRGNHDRHDIYKRFGVTDVNGNVHTIQGVRFAGMEGSFRYKNGDFPSFTQYESLALAKRMPLCDVFMSHDAMFTRANYNIAHTGLAGITYYIYEKKPCWHIHGHMHRSCHGTYANGTKEISVYPFACFEI